MKVFKDIPEWQHYRKNLNSASVGFVATMGALHLGHLSLVERSKQENDQTVVSLFLNPTQFNNPEDLNKYPKTFEEDLALLKDAQCDCVLAPSYEQIYPDQYHYGVKETNQSQMLCGTARPGHFDGVLTVVLKLFNLVHPTRAYFGEKDYQQAMLIRGMVDAFFLPTQIVTCPIVRAEDGLALSSRNVNLTPEERKVAPLFYRTLRRKLPLHEIRSSLKDLGFKVDYVEDHWGRRLAAVHLGNVRLIDNVEI
jgi:pantoate--beta-alanine ligase